MAIQCEICNSANLLKQNGVFVCQDCGAKYTTEDLKKTVSVAAAAFAVSAPVAEKNEEPVQEEAKSAKDSELVQLLEWARDAYAGNNKGAGDAYLDQAVKKDSCDRDVMQLCIEQGRIIDRYVLEKMIKQTPDAEKTAAYEFAYAVMEKQGLNLGFPFNQSVYDRYKGNRTTVEGLRSTTIPNLKMEGIWNIDRMLWIYFKSAIRNMNEYQLPKDDISEGILASSGWGIVSDIFSTDRYLQDAEEFIPSALKVDLYKSFHKACDTVLNGKFCAHPSSKSCYYEKITDRHYLYGKDWEKAKEVRAKYKNLLEKLEADAVAAIAAQKAERNAAFWAEHPEEHSRLKSEKLLLEANIRKLQNEHQIDPQKTAMERVQRDLTKYGWEMRSCGIFQGKRKKELAALIEEMHKKEQECRAAFEKNTIEYEKSLKDLQNQLADVDKKLNRE